MEAVSTFVSTAVFGAIVVALTWFFRKLKWEFDGPKALWLTMGVSVVVAVADLIVFGGGIPKIVTCSLSLAEPMVFFTCLGEVFQNIITMAGPLFFAAQVIYKALRKEFDGQSIAKRVLSVNL